jgi:hypothetical protein
MIQIRPTVYGWLVTITRNHIIERVSFTKKEWNLLSEFIANHKRLVESLEG